MKTSFKKMSLFIFFTLFVFFFARMYKFKLNPSKLLYNLSFILFSLMLFASCGVDHKTEVEAIEKLEVSLEGNLKNLEIDDALFSTRIEYIEGVLRYFSNDYSTETSLELGNNLDKLKTLKKIYAKRLNEQASNLKEQGELGIQLNTLKTDISNGAMSKEEFKSYYTTEKIDTEVLLNSSVAVKKALYEVEPEYSRIIQTLSPLLPGDLR
tara:strand:- start:1325 stop:1954 length:630 start_codon:yes stop_codon:yes gene_type:complete